LKPSVERWSLGGRSWGPAVRVETEIVLHYGFAINSSRRETFVPHQLRELPAAFPKKERGRENIVILSGIAIWRETISMRVLSRQGPWITETRQQHNLSHHDLFSTFHGFSYTTFFNKSLLEKIVHMLYLKIFANYILFQQLHLLSIFYLVLSYWFILN